MSDQNRKIIEGKVVDRFDDIFHAQDDDIDENEDADIDFDQFFTDFDKNDDEHEPINISWVQHTTAAEEESETEKQKTEHLSQKLSQLATSNVEPTAPPPPPTTTTTAAVVVEKRTASTPTTPISSSAAAAAATTTTTTTKKFKPEFDKSVVFREQQHEREQMPKYLSHTEKTFEEIITPLLPQSTAATNRILIEELRQMALLEHKLQLVNLNISLWTIYLKSGIGKLNEEEEKAKEDKNRSLLQQLQQSRPLYPCIWHNRLKSIIATDPNVNLQERTILNHSTCLNYVNRMLGQFQEQLLSYQTQIQERRERLKSNLTPEMKQIITNFVEEYGVGLERIVNEGLIATVKFDYMDRMIELEFQREDAFQEHDNVFQAMTKAYTAKETAKMEVELLKQRVAHHQLSPLFESFQLPAPPALETIQDESIRQHLIYRYEQLIQRTKSEMMVIHIRTAEVKMNECNKQYDIDLKKFYQKQRLSYGTDKFNDKMSDIMFQRFALIDERLKTLLELKVRFFVKAPTAVNKD